MPLEPSFDNLDDLNVLNPASGDNVSEGDDHLRGIKNAVRGNVTGDATQTRLRVDGVDRFLALLVAVANSAATVADGADVQRPVGFNLLPRVDVPGNKQLAAVDNGTRQRLLGAAPVITLPIDVSFPTDGVVTLLHAGTGGALLTAPGGNIEFFNGDEVAGGDSRNLSEGGVAQLVYQGAGVWEAWGMGVS